MDRSSKNANDLFKKLQQKKESAPVVSPVPEINENLSLGEGAFGSMQRKKREEEEKKRVGKGIIAGVDAPLSTSNEGVDEPFNKKKFVLQCLIDDLEVKNFAGVIKDLFTLYLMNELKSSVFDGVEKEDREEIEAILEEFSNTIFSL